MDPITLVIVAVVVLVVVGFVIVAPRRRPPVDSETDDALTSRQPPSVGDLPAADDVDLAREGPLPADVDSGEAQTPTTRQVTPEVAVPEVAVPETAVPETAAPEVAAPEAAAPEAEVKVQEVPLTARERFVARLSRARGALGRRIAAILGEGLDDEAWEELEESLIAADVGVEASLELVEGLRDRVRESGVTSGSEALALLKEILRLELSVADRTLARRADGTTTWLVTGVNGSGKTTSIGKLAARHTRAGETVVLAAADTFRAAAAEQLELWGERSGARVVRHGEGADPAAVAFDGWKAAEAADADLLMVDTAGRLQNKKALMEELSKTKRVLERGAGPCDEVLLVLDATTGQNGLSQAKAFLEAVEVTGVVLTKLDGTAKGGIVIAIQRQLGLPVKLVGLGEGVDDLADFDVDAFVEALFDEVAQDVDLDDLEADAGAQPSADGALDDAAEGSRR